MPRPPKRSMPSASGARYLGTIFRAMADQPSDRRSASSSELERIEEDALYSAKGHFEASADLHKLYVALVCQSP
jgi:hypothetical protein